MAHAARRRPARADDVNGALVGIDDKCLDIGGGDPVQGAPLVIHACNGSPSPQWVSH